MRENVEERPEKEGVGNEISPGREIATFPVEHPELLPYQCPALNGHPDHLPPLEMPPDPSVPNRAHTEM